MFLNICLLFKKYDVTLWVKELQYVAHTIFIVSPIHMDCIKPKIFALGSVLEKLVHPNATKSVFFSEKSFAQKSFVCQCGTGVDSIKWLGNL